MSGPYLLAIDAGTGSCRAVLFTETGEQAGVGQREWTHHEPPGVPGGQDFDVVAGWQAIAACVRDALRSANNGAGAAGADVAAVAATSMREGMVLYDAGGREIFACPNVDSRAFAEAEDLIQNFVEEPPDQQLPRDRRRNAARAEIKHLILIDLPGSGTVTALHVVGHDLETWHGVGLGVVAEQEVAHFLIGVGEMRVRLDPDQTAKGISGATAERIFEKQVTLGVRRSVILQSTRIEFLCFVTDRNREHVAVGAFAGKAAQTFKARIFSPKSEVKIQCSRIAGDGGGVDLDAQRLVAPVLRADICHFRTGSHDQVVYAAGEAGPLAIGRATMFDQSHFGLFLGDDERVGENCGVHRMQPVKRLERHFDLHVARHVKESPRSNERLMECGKLGGTKSGRLTHEMLPEQILVFNHRPLERLKDHAGFAQFFWKRIALEKLVIGEDKAARGFLNSNGTSHDLSSIRC
jgi:hypothetical protein